MYNIIKINVKNINKSIDNYNIICYNIYRKIGVIQMIHKILCNYEKKYFNKLIKKCGYIPITQGDELMYLISTKTNKVYYPEFNKKLILK